MPHRRVICLSPENSSPCGGKITAVEPYLPADVAMKVLNEDTDPLRSARARSPVGGVELDLDMSMIVSFPPSVVIWVTTGSAFLCKLNNNAA